MNIHEQISQIRENINTIEDIRIKAMNNTVLDYIEAEVGVANYEAASEFLVWAMDYYDYEDIHESFRSLYDTLTNLIFDYTKTIKL